MKTDFREFHRIPHLMGSSNHIAADDLEIQFDFKGPVWVEEKVDGANMGVLYDGKNLALRNRKHILKKGWEKTDTPAKIQFRRAWNWMHNHEKDFQKIHAILESPIIVFGEWLWATHSIHYNKLPDLLIGHSIWSCEDRKFLGPEKMAEVSEGLKIKFVKSELIQDPTLETIIQIAEMESAYGDCVREGVVVKTQDERGFLIDTFKLVNRFFTPRQDFNQNLILNKVCKTS